MAASQLPTSRSTTSFRVSCKRTTPHGRGECLEPWRSVPSPRRSRRWGSPTSGSVSGFRTGWSRLPVSIVHAGPHRADEAADPSGSVGDGRDERDRNGAEAHFGVGTRTLGPNGGDRSTRHSCFPEDRAEILGGPKATPDVGGAPGDPR